MLKYNSIENYYPLFFLYSKNITIIYKIYIMVLQYVRTKNELPKEEMECPICMEEIDLDEIKNSVPNCVICSNGHRMHRNCFNQLHTGICPICRDEKITNCYGTLKGYAYGERKGGKRSGSKRSGSKQKISKRRTNRKKTNRKKTNKKRTNKRRK